MRPQGAQEDLNEELKKTIKAKKLAGFDKSTSCRQIQQAPGTGGGTGGAGASVFDGIAMPEYDVDTSKLDTSIENLKSKLAGVSKFVKQMWDTLYKNNPAVLGKLEYLIEKQRQSLKINSILPFGKIGWEFMTKVWGFWGIAKVWGMLLNSGWTCSLSTWVRFCQLESAIG